MTRAEYNRMTSDQFKGRRARVVNELRSGLYRIPRGTIVTIKRKFSGFEIETTACRCCRISTFMTRVSPENLELAP